MKSSSWLIDDHDRDIIIVIILIIRMSDVFHGEFMVKVKLFSGKDMISRGKRKTLRRIRRKRIKINQMRQETWIRNYFYRICKVSPFHLNLSNSSWYFLLVQYDTRYRFYIYLTRWAIFLFSLSFFLSYRSFVDNIIIKICWYSVWILPFLSGNKLIQWVIVFSIVNWMKAKKKIKRNKVKLMMMMIVTEINR